MQTLSGHFQINGKATKLLLIAFVGGLVITAFAPKHWEAVREVAQLLMMFSSGMLASQHASIWEPTLNNITPRQSGQENEV